MFGQVRDGEVRIWLEEWDEGCCGEGVMFVEGTEKKGGWGA